MTQLTYYPPRDNQEPAPAAVNHDTPRGLTEVRHGYTLHDLDDQAGDSRA